MRAIADCAATLGSRFNLIFDPENHRIYQDSSESFPGLPMHLTAALKTAEGEEKCLPFKGSSSCFGCLEYFSSFTGLEYQASDPGSGIELTLSVRAPFYPEDIKLSTAPFYYVDLAVKRTGKSPEGEANVKSGELIFALDIEGGEFQAMEDGFQYFLPASPGRETDTIARIRGMGDYEPYGNNGLCVPFDFEEAEEQHLSLLWSGWAETAGLDVRGSAGIFKYSRMFSSEAAMADWAIERQESIEKKCRFIDAAIQDSSLGPAAKNFCEHAFHTYLANTWWVVDDDERDWFSVWDGGSYYHSPMSLVYNNALLYLNLWPELLDMLLEEWADFEIRTEVESKKGSCGKSYLPHDMGAGNVIGKQACPYPTEVESNSDYLLLMAARTFFSGDLKFFEKSLPLCRRLAANIIDADSNGNGFPNSGTANSIRYAGPALSFSSSQTYLSIKAQSALWSLGELEELLKDGKNKSEQWKAFAAKGVKTLSENAWVKDHYAVSLQRSCDDIVDPVTGEALGGGELEGWDDYSIYSTNGLLLPFITNIKTPRWNYLRLIGDIESAENATRTPYGSSQCTSGRDKVCFSQNLWRDYTAAYCGIDFLNKVEEYRDFQQVANQHGNLNLYADHTGKREFSFSPRGVVAFGVFMAAAGLRINRLGGEILMAPVKRTLRIPLLALADWKKMRIPWINVDTREGITTVRCTEVEMFDKLKVEVVGAELERG